MAQIDTPKDEFCCSSLKRWISNATSNGRAKCLWVNKYDLLLLILILKMYNVSSYFSVAVYYPRDNVNKIISILCRTMGSLDIITMFKDWSLSFEFCAKTNIILIHKLSSPKAHNVFTIFFFEWIVGHTNGFHRLCSCIARKRIHQKYLWFYIAMRLKKFWIILFGILLFVAINPNCKFIRKEIVIEIVHDNMQIDSLASPGVCLCLTYDFFSVHNV